MNKYLLLIAIRIVRFINLLLRRDCSRLNLSIVRYLNKKNLTLNIQTSDNLEWLIKTSSYVDSLVAAEAEEPHIINFLKTLKLDGACIVDMGANIGGLTLRFAQAVGSQGKVIAYEPNPIIADRLKRNLSLNNFSHVEVIEKGVWSGAGSFTLHLPVHGNTGTASLVDEKSNNGGEQIKVLTERFDERWHKLGKPLIQLVKMDIQGAELEALKGMDSLLKEQQPALIIEIESEGSNLPLRLSVLAPVLQVYGYSTAVCLNARTKASYSLESLLNGSHDHLGGDFYFS